MAKKQTIAYEIGSALGSAAARAEQLIAGNTTKKTTKPAAKRTAAAKHSTNAPKKTAAKTEVASAAAEVSIPTTAAVVSQEAIAEQAYLYWEARGFQGGDSVSDWVRAEEELRQRAMAAQA
jgi:hypothetical protein